MRRKANKSVITTRLGAIALSGLMILCCALSAAAENADARNGGPKRILIVHSFGPRFEPFATAASSFRTELVGQLAEPIEFYEVSLETARFADGEIDEPVAEYLRALCASQPPDLVAPVAGPAARFCARHRDRLFPNVPILVVATEERVIRDIDWGTNAVSVNFSLNLTGFVEDILRILPETANMYVVLGDSPLEKYWVEETRREWRALSDRVAFSWLNGLTFVEMQQRVASLPPNSAILFGMLAVDAAGVPYERQFTLETLRDVANAPIFGLYYHQLDHGSVGGRAMRVHEIGEEAARTAVRILSGESPASIPSRTIRPGDPVYDWRELKRWGIDERRLAPGSEFLFREPTFWSAHRWLIVAVGAFCAFQALLIVRLLASRGRLRSAQAELREHQSHMNLAARAARLGVWTLDLAKDRLWITDEGRTLLGWEESSPLNLESFIATLRSDEREPARRTLQRAIDGDGDFEMENRIVLGDGKERWIATRGRVEFNGDRRPVCLRGVSMDVTASKQASIDVVELRGELSHAGRVTLLGQFTASLAHELGQPLGAILRNAEAAELFLKDPSPDLDEVQAILTDVRSDGERAGAVIERLRTLLKRRRIDMQTLAWDDVVEDAMRILRGDATARGITLEINTPPGLPAVRGDRVHLQQVLLNLVANAMDAMNGAAGVERRVTVRARSRNDGFVECAVSDTGAGITPDRVDRIFEPFVTTKPNGMGMGLSISRTIVEAHGGRLWAENGAGRGAIFRFTVPVLPVTAAAP